MVAKSRPYGIALVLRIPKTPAQRGLGVRRVVAQKQAAGHWEIGRTNNVGIADITGKMAPVGKIDLGFRTVDAGLRKSNWKADGRIEQLIVVGIVIYAAPKGIYVQAELPEKALGKTCFVIIAL